MSRGGAALITWPNDLLLKSPSTATGPKNWAWLKVLNVSNRNCSAFDSENRNVRSRAKSKLSMPGPWKLRREAEPGVPRALGLKRDVLKYGSPLRGSPLRFSAPGLKPGKSMLWLFTPLGKLPIKDRSVSLEMVTGKPEASRVIPEIDHPSVRNF